MTNQKDNIPFWILRKYAFIFNITDVQTFTRKDLIEILNKSYAQVGSYISYLKKYGMLETVVLNNRKYHAHRLIYDNKIRKIFRKKEIEIKKQIDSLRKDITFFEELLSKIKLE